MQTDYVYRDNERASIGDYVVSAVPDRPTCLGRILREEDGQAVVEMNGHTKRYYFEDLLKQLP